MNTSRTSEKVNKVETHATNKKNNKSLKPSWEMSASDALKVNYLTQVTSTAA